MPVPGSEHLLNGWVVNDLYQAWNLRSLFRKFSTRSFPQKQSLRQRLTFKKFIRERCQKTGMQDNRQETGKVSRSWRGCFMVLASDTGG